MVKTVPSLHSAVSMLSAILNRIREQNRGFICRRVKAGTDRCLETY